MGIVNPPSPILFGANNTSTNLQNAILQANGSLLAYNGPKNYISYGNFENGQTTGWSLGTVGTLTNGIPTATPTFGSGAAGTLSIAAASTTPLAGAYSLAYVSSAATTVGNMLASQVYNIDIEDQAKVLTFKFYYEAFSGSTNINMSGTSSNSYGVAVWDVTNSSWLSLAGNFAMTQGSGAGIATGTCQTNSTTTQVRLVIYNVNATAGAATMYFDDLFLGPQTSPIGPVMTDWVSYTPSYVGFGTVTGSSVFSRRVGDSLEVRGVFTSGTPTGVLASIGLGSSGASGNVIIDSSKAGGSVVGSLWMSQMNSTYFSWSILATPGTSGVAIGFQSSTTNAVTGTVGTGNAAVSGAQLQFYFTVPIVGWSSNVQMSSDTDTRVIAAYYNGLPTGTINTTYNTITYPTLISDTSGSYSAGTYTAPITGYYDIEAQVDISATFTVGQLTALAVFINGSELAESSQLACVATSYDFVTPIGLKSIKLNAGDLVTIRAKTAGSSPSFINAGTKNWFSISRQSGPAVIAATESVNATYGLTTAQTPTAGGILKYDTKVKDTHNEYSTVTGLYTIPVSGEYRISSVGSTSAASLYVKKNTSTALGYLMSITGSNIFSGTLSVPLLAGDTVGIYSDSATSFFAPNANGFLNQVTFERTGN